MKNKNNAKNRAKDRHGTVRFEELLADDRFDDEDADSVTEDTLEFLSLDDEAIENWQETHAPAGKPSGPEKSSARIVEVYEDEDEDYEDEDYEDEDYEDDDEDYEDEDYEDDDEDYEDEDDEYDDDGSFAARIKYFFREMNGLDAAVAVLGVVVLAGAIATGVIYFNARSTQEQVAAFANVGEELEGISVIGESGLIAVTESARLGNMIGTDGEDFEEWGEQEEEEEDENGEVEVTLRLTSILSDMKIKFVNKKSGRLIGGVPFEVEVSGPKNYTLKDDDKDGVIYQTEVPAGNYDVTILPLSGEAADKYRIVSGRESVKVTDKIAYQKVDVTDEVKKESEINVAKEEAAQQNTVEESSLQDTVEWVESTKMPIDGGGGDADYEAVPLENITDPWKTASAFRKMSDTGIDNTGSENTKNVDGDDTQGGTGGDSEKPEVTVSLDRTSLSLEEGNSDTLSVSDRDGKSYSATWSSSDEGVATVSGGTVTAKGAGTATITAEVGESQDSIIKDPRKLTCTVTVTAKETPKPEVTVRLNMTSLSLEEGKRETLNVLSDSDGKSYSATWSSSDEGVATVSGGTVTAHKAGTAKITAKVGESQDSVIVGSRELTCAVTVTAGVKQVEVWLDNTELNLVKNQKKSLKVVDGSGNSYSATWSSSNNDVATVSDGTVTAVKDGSAVITAKVGAVNGVAFKNTEFSCRVTVGDKNYKSVAIDMQGKEKMEVGVGRKLTLKAKSDPEGAELVWSCTNENVAKVDQNGVVTGVSVGDTKIRVACKGNDAINCMIRIYVTASGVDSAAKLKDKNGNQLYYKKDGRYIEATYQDFLEHTHFYKRKASAYRYTGWQTIDGSLYYFDKNGNYVTGDQVIQGAKYSFGSDGKLTKTSGTMGIDVSKHNGNIDWNAVKNSGVSYVIIRCGYRGYSTGVLVEDPKFHSNIKGAKAAGLKVGAYFYSQAVNEVEAVEEASMAIDLVKGYGLNYPLFLDVEGSGGRADGISRDMRTAVCKTFCQTVQNSGISAGIYANKNWFTEKINTASLTNYKLWLAQYASTPTYTATRYDLWQYSSKGKVSGISTNVDMNISYVNY